MAAVPPAEFAAIAADHNLKADEIVWADRNVFGLLVGFKNGTSRYLERAGALPPRSMNV